ncbi:hypothetical protein [Pseudogulbenkiania subflava]|uniref:hypothetical protein n=1 Tax=Pseudogulbenkiania subflava TaxID=451637 RepID=UPI00117A6CF7|nr:hypothetical protein [Pseudogulbenkiania subflava]
MKKPLTLAALVVISVVANATNAIGVNQQYQLISSIASEEIDENITTPSFMQYMQNGKRTPSCSIILKNNEYKVVFFESDDSEDYSNCNKIYPPIITKIKGQYYAAYRYSEEETRGSFIDGYVVMNLTKNSFHICQNQEKITAEMKKSKKQTSKLLNSIIERNGCL